MKNIKLLPILLAAGWIGFSACTNGSAPQSKPLSVTLQTYAYKKCLRDSLCAEMNLTYPVISGGADSTAARRLNDSIQSAVYLAANADASLPLKPALDSAASQLFNLLKGDNEAGSELDMSYSMELNSKILLQNDHWLSVEMNGYSFTGGAHGYYYTVLNTFDLKTAESLRLSDLVSDTTALRSMLETAFVKAHQADMPDAKLEDLLLMPDERLALPLNYCLLPTGIRFLYNPYEVAAYAIGQTDILLTWEQLGALADRKKWLP